MQRPHQRSRESAASSIALLSRDGYQPLEKVGKPDCDVASVMLQPRLTGRVPRLDLLHAPPLTLKARRHQRSGECQEGVTVAGTTERHAWATQARPDPVESAKRMLTETGAFLMPPADLNRCVGADENAWTRFSSHWEELVSDRYAAEMGTRRLRRYGHFLFRPADGFAQLMPHRAFAQPEDSNPLYIERDRYFEPLTDALVEDPLLHGLLRLLGHVATALEGIPEWSVKVTPFRVLASADGEGQPTPEGLHRDGVTLVTSLLVGRRNATGGESSVFDLDGHQLLTTTLSEPGTLLLGDDRRTLHGVSPIRALDPAEPAQRDVLVITFAPF